MASLIGAIRSSFGDPWWLIKFGFTYAVLYFALGYALETKSIEQKVLVCIILAMFFIGCGTVTMYKNINNKFPLFPGISDIIEIIKKTFGSLIIVLPVSALTFGIVYFVNTLKFEPIVFYIIIGFVSLVMLPFLLIPLVLYSAKGQLKDAFKLNLVILGAGNFIMSIILWILQVAIIFGIAFICIYSFLKQMINTDNLSMNFLIYAFSIITFFCTMIYISDLYDDIIPALEENKPNVEDF